jgi:hypothetical protein
MLTILVRLLPISRISGRKHLSVTSFRGVAAELQPPMRRSVPNGALGFGNRLILGHPNVTQLGRIQPQQMVALAPHGKGITDNFQQVKTGQTGQRVGQDTHVAPLLSFD